MKAYLAIVIDCFQEALASRVMWVLLLLSTLLLLALAPLGYTEQATTGLPSGTVEDWPEFLAAFQRQASNDPGSPANHVVSLLDAEVRDELYEIKVPKQRGPKLIEIASFWEKLEREINKTMQQGDFYSEPAWSGKPFLSDEGRDLAEIDVGELTEQQILRRNRLALEAAFPKFVDPSPPTSIAIAYATLESPPFPISKPKFQDDLMGWFTWGLRWFVGTVGVLVAILVTAGFIPQMFDPGSLNLLLSKPISRSLMFLSKYLGGCAFILINAGYLILGLWLILGLRFGIWNHNFLLTIPIYVFVFAVYYAVSALAGVVWRSPIVAIIVSIVFWAACFGVGAAKSVCENWAFDKYRITQIVPAGESMMAMNEMGFTTEWDAEEDAWNEVLVSKQQNEIRGALFALPTSGIPPQLKPVGVVYDEDNDRLIALQRSVGPGGTTVALTGTRGKSWKAVEGAPGPSSSTKMLQNSDGKIIVATSLFGIYRASGDPGVKREPVKIFGMDVPLSGGSAFRPVPTLMEEGNERPLILTSPADVAINLQDDRLAAYTRGKLSVLRIDNKQYELENSRSLEIDTDEGVALAFGGKAILLASANGTVHIFDSTTLEDRKEETLEGKNPPRFVAASSDGRWFSIIYQNGNLWLYDAESDTFSKASVAGQGTISAAHFKDARTLLVAAYDTRVTEYSLPEMREVARYSPSMTVPGGLFHYVVIPLYTIFPKPGELDRTADYFISGGETSSGTSISDLSMAQSELNPWLPIWSSLAFTIVVLLIACVYVERQEF